VNSSFIKTQTETLEAKIGEEVHLVGLKSRYWSEIVLSLSKPF
jgi:hypothetical protein